MSPSGVLFARRGLSDSDKWSSACSSMSPNTVGFSHYQARTKPVPLSMNGSVKLFNKWTIQTINNLNVMLRKLTLKVDADIRSLLFPSSARQSLTLEWPSDSLFSHWATMTEARCVVRPHVDRVLTFGLSCRVVAWWTVKCGLQMAFLRSVKILPCPQLPNIFRTFFFLYQSQSFLFDDVFT